MGVLRNLVSGIRGYDSRLSPFEMAVVAAVAQALPRDGGQRLLERARAINRVQRLCGGEETTVFQMKGGCPVFPPDTAILDHPRSVRFARFGVKSADQLSRLSGVMFLHAGNLSSIDFNRPTKFADAGKIDDIAVELLGPPFIDPDSEEEAAGDWPVGFGRRDTAR